MTIARVGILPTMTDPLAQHFFKSELVLSRAEFGFPKFGRAAAGSLTQPAMVHRIPTISGCVVWGTDEDAMAILVSRNRCALMLIVTAKKHASGGKLQDEAEAAAEAGSTIHVVNYTGSKKGAGYDLGTGCTFVSSPDLTRPPQQQFTPQIPRRPVAPRVHSAPAVPRAAAATAAPATPASSTAGKAAAAPPTLADPAPAATAPAGPAPTDEPTPTE
jgi:hypothetical protein